MTKEKANEILRSVVSSYETIADHFSATRANLWDELLPLRDKVQDRMRVVDVGCGNGRILQLFKGRQVSYVGIDNSAKLLAKAQLFAKQFPEIDSTFLFGDARKLPCADRAFDMTLCIATLHHIPSDDYRLTAAKELYRVTAKGGMLCLTNWSIGKQFRYVFQQVRERLAHPSRFLGLGRKDFLIPWTLPDGKKVFRYYYAFSEIEISRLLNSVGFNKIEHVTSHNPGWVKKGQKRNIVTLAQKPF